MNILFIAQLSSIHSRRWISFFPKLDNTVFVLDTSGPREDKFDLENVTIFRSEYKQRRLPLVIDFFFRYRRFKQYLKNIINKTKPDVIHIQGLNIYSYVISQLRFHPFIITIWGSDLLFYLKRNIRAKVMGNFSLKSADLITCDAYHIVEELKKYKVPSERIKLNFFGTDVNKFSPSQRDDNLAKQLGFRPDSKIILSLRALNPVYNIETFIRSVPFVIKSHPEAVFVIVGNGSEKEKLVQLTNDLKINSHIHFAGRISDDDMQRYTASGDIYVSTSLSDAGLAASTAEAMACCISVVISNFGDNQIWLENEKAGLLFDMKDYKMLADKIIFLLDKPEMRIQMGKHGRSIINEKNNWHTEMTKMNETYKYLKSLANKHD